MNPREPWQRLADEIAAMLVADDGVETVNSSLSADSASGMLSSGQFSRSEPMI